ncbi:hypothetical protein D3C71_1552390 [compost metagenome]
MITSVDTSTLPAGVMILMGTDRPNCLAMASLASMGSRPNSESEYTKATLAPGFSLAMCLSRMPNISV